jgi:hypothetical protein
VHNLRDIARSSKFRPSELALLVINLDANRAIAGVLATRRNNRE